MILFGIYVVEFDFKKFNRNYGLIHSSGHLGHFISKELAILFETFIFILQFSASYIDLMQVKVNVMKLDIFFQTKQNPRIQKYSCMCIGVQHTLRWLENDSTNVNNIAN